MIRVSPSQLSLWTECKRKFGFKYLDGVRVPQKPSAALGDEVQTEQLDPWLLTGRPFDFSRPLSAEIALKLSEILPRPGAPGIQVRRNFSLPSPSGGAKFEYTGQLDIFAPDSSVVPLLDGGVPLVGDVKTTKNLRYAKTREALQTDFQAQLYAMETIFARGVDAVDLVWFYGRTVPPHRVQRVHLRVTADHVAREFVERIEPLANEVAATRLAKPRAADLPPSPLMCDQYGGCDFRHVCNLSPSVQAAAVNEASMEASAAFFDSLKKKVGAPAPAPVSSAPVAPAQPPVAGPEQLPAWATAPVDPMHARQEAARQAATTARAPVAAPAAVAPPPTVTETVSTTTDGVTVRTFDYRGVQAPAAINPPESQLPPAAEPARRGRKPGPAGPPGPMGPAGAPAPAAELNLPQLVAQMRQLGIKRFKADSIEIELA